MYGITHNTRSNSFINIFLLQLLTSHNEYLCFDNICASYSYLYTRLGMQPEWTIANTTKVLILSKLFKPFEQKAKETNINEFKIGLLAS